jgi:hypothetical protein
VSYALADNVENLTLRSFTAAIDGTGNALNNVLTGSSTANVLHGGDGDDTLAGGAGDGDRLYGDAGNDTYLFNLGDGRDTISEDATINTDVLRFGPGILQSDLTFSEVASDLVITHTNGTDQVTVQNWYAGSGYQMTRLEFADGSQMSAADAGNRGMQLPQAILASTNFGVNPQPIDATAPQSLQASSSTTELTTMSLEAPADTAQATGSPSASESDAGASASPAASAPSTEPPAASAPSTEPPAASAPSLEPPAPSAPSAELPQDPVQARIESLIDAWFDKASSAHAQLDLSQFEEIKRGVRNGVATQDEAARNAAQWNSAQARLSAHFDRYADIGVDAGDAFLRTLGNPVSVGAGGVNAVGLPLGQGNELKPLEGLKEGFARLA